MVSLDNGHNVQLDYGRLCLKVTFRFIVAWQNNLDVNKYINCNAREGSGFVN